VKENRVKTAQEFIAAITKLPPESRKRVQDAIRQDRSLPDLMTDSEVAEVLRIKTDTLIRHLRNGHPRGLDRNVLDVRLIEHVKVGGKRRWLRASVIAAISGKNE
jgi:hypothetical protein